MINIRRVYGLLFAIMLLANHALAKPGHGHGGGPTVPELSIAGAVALLIGGFLIIRNRRHQK